MRSVQSVQIFVNRIISGVSVGSFVHVITSVHFVEYCDQDHFLYSRVDLVDLVDVTASSCFNECECGNFWHFHLYFVDVIIFGIVVRSFVSGITPIH